MKLALALAILIASCAAPAILGGPTPETTSHACPGTGGLRCQNWEQCPAPFSGGRCEAADPTFPGADPVLWARRADAGGDAR